MFNKALKHELQQTQQQLAMYQQCLSSIKNDMLHLSLNPQGQITTVNTLFTQETELTVVTKNQTLTAQAVATINSGKQTTNDVVERVQQTSAVINDIRAGARTVVDAVSAFTDHLDEQR